MLKYLLILIAVPVGVVALFLAWLLLPSWALGLWQKDWDPNRLSVEQGVLDWRHRLPVLWARLPAVSRGRYVLALHRFQSADDCLWADDSGARRLQFQRIRSEHDLEICLYLILSGAGPSHHEDLRSRDLMKAFDNDGFRCRYYNGAVGIRPGHSVDCRRTFYTFADAWRLFPTVSDWTVSYVFEDTILGWVPGSKNFDFGVSWRFEGASELPVYTSITFSRFSK